jgi:hypothetical protein
VEEALPIQPALPEPCALARARRSRPPKSNVDRAVELVGRFTDEEMEEFRERLARLVILFALPQPAGRY